MSSNTLNKKKIIGNQECTGCFLCKDICKNKAIELYEGELGFLYPRIDNRLCTNCGLCAETCSKLNNLRFHDRRDTCFAMCANDEIRSFSSSGGMFYLIAKSIVENGGYVCGAAFENGVVKHILVNTISELKLLCKSKYVQSNTDGVYTKIKSLLENGEVILFSGTPCQCQAVKYFCGEYENLFIIDILCMGVPSQDFLNRFMQDRYHYISSKIDFRYKTQNIWNYDFYIKFEGKDKVYEILNEDFEYFSLFNKGLTIRESCVECKYIGTERVGDISLGDYWNIETFDPKLNDGKGTSLVLVNTSKGNELIDKIRAEVKLLEETPIAVAYQRNNAVSMPMGHSYSRERLKEEYAKGRLADLKEKILFEKADCGILNYWSCDDNGAILTAYALQLSLRKMGYTSLLINCGFNRKADGISRHFEKKYLKTTLPIYDYASLNDRFESFIVGSDQVFRREWVPNSFFLDFVDDKKKKIAVAASFGIDCVNCNEKQKREMTFWLRRFNAISTREISGLKILKSMRTKGVRIADPVFWIKNNEYVEELSLEKKDEKIIAVYYRDSHPLVMKKIENVAQKMGAKVKQLDDNTEVTDFVETIYNAYVVFTDSYHGVCFSLIFNKKFICTMNEMRGNSRFITLVEIFNLPNECFVNLDDFLQTEECEFISIDWNIVNKKIEEEKQKAIDWTRKALNKKEHHFYKIGSYFLAIEFIVQDFCRNTKTFISLLNQKKDVVVCYGAGDYGLKAIEEFGETIDFFIDKDKKKHMIENYSVYRLNTAKKLINEKSIIVLSVSDEKVKIIKESLLEQGINNIFTMNEYRKTFLSNRKDGQFDE